MTYIPLIKSLTNEDGRRFEPADEMRILPPLSAAVVTGDGPDRVELGVAGGLLASLTGTLPIVVTAGLNPVVSINAATGATAGSMSSAHWTKLEGIGAGAVVTNVGVTGALTLGGSGIFPVIGIPAASSTLAGSQSTAHWVLVNGATAAGTPSTIVKRGASNEIAVGIITADGLDVGTSGSKFGSFISLTPYAETYAASLAMNMRAGGRHEVTLTGNITFTAPTNLADGAGLEVFITQGGAGSYGATWASSTGGFYFPTGLSGTLTATSVGDCDYYEFKHRGAPTSHWVCVAHYKYSPP